MMIMSSKPLAGSSLTFLKEFPAFFSTEIFTMFMVSKSCIRWFVLSPLAALLVGFTAVHAEPVSWMERYALAKDREAMLAELIPGSDDYFFYHCLCNYEQHCIITWYDRCFINYSL